MAAAANRSAAAVLVALVLASTLLSTSSAAVFNETRVMTFNVLCQVCSGEYGRWRDRLPGIGDTMQRTNPHLIGIQEPINDVNVEQLQVYLPNHAPVYANGTLRGYDLNYPDAMIFYEKNTFELLEQGHYWLSETPDRPSIGWSPSIPRIVVWARLLDRRSNIQFIFISTHFDPNEANKTPSANLFMERTGAWVRQGYPVIITGDFNCRLDSEPYKVLVNGNGDGFTMQNTFDLADSPRFDRNSELGNEYGCPRPSTFPACLIDHVFLASPPSITWRVTDWVVDIRQFTPESPYFPSDHRAYTATVTY